MNKEEDLVRIKEALKTINKNVDTSKAEEIWEDFSYTAFEKSWVSTTDSGLALFKEKAKDFDLFFSALTPSKVREYDEPFIYFLLWIKMVYKEE